MHMLTRRSLDAMALPPKAALCPARLRCLQVEMPSLAAGIATTRQADILVGAHGANIANSWLLRPGSSVIELTMYEFELNTAHNNLARRNWLVSGDCGKCGFVGLVVEGGAALSMGS
jgi:hypothetical protein